MARSFCCVGCEAAALTITGLGLGDYYRLREASGTRPEIEPGEFSPYDDSLFQATFVRQVGNGIREASLLLEGVRCAACLWLIEETLKRVPGVQSIEVNYVTRRASLRWDAAVASLSYILQRIAAIGYRAHPYQAEKIDVLRRAEQRQWLWRLFVAGFGMMQVMMYAVPAYVAGIGDLSAEYETLMRWASFVLTVPVVAYSAQPFFVGAWRGLRAKKMGMDLPVALGVLIAFVASTWATFTHRGEVYFDSLTMFVFLLLLGRYLEMLARNAASRALAHLAQLRPNIAARLQNYPGSREAAPIPVAQLAVGDVILVKPGESIAADGCVLEGRSAVNEALLSGESMPVAKKPGADVVGGSVNVESPLIVRVTRVGEAGTLASIVRLVEQAAAQRQPMADMADRYAQRFVWLILAVTLIAVAVWFAIDPARAPWIAVSLLVATCPCALSLATPVALTTATGRLARQGMIVTSGHSIEAL
ncbi:MAG TPA: heavy metal translocating P-type ATPase metal-binding domain-containing protein, partial [Burkholderiales bacterium]|nr:heavy metal translocating P-type ATPase metal-binding domain-containing protein [Burkholderiales bacterium]